MREMDILEQAEQVAASYLSLVELLAESKKFQADNQSRLVCRCPGCRALRAQTLMWTQAMREAPAPADVPRQAYAAAVEHASQGIASD